jgi:uncharacterized membrane protein
MVILESVRIALMLIVPLGHTITPCPHSQGDYTPWGIRLTPVVTSLAIFTVAMSFAAHLRRLNLPPEDRFSVEFRKGLDTIKREIVADEKSKLDKALTVILIITIIISISALVYVIVTPKQGEKFTEFYIRGREAGLTIIPLISLLAIRAQ